MLGKANLSIRKKIEKSGVHYWEIADRIGISDATICKWFRRELPEERKEQILQAIEDLSKDRR